MRPSRIGALIVLVSVPLAGCDRTRSQPVDAAAPGADASASAPRSTVPTGDEAPGAPQEYELVAVDGRPLPYAHAIADLVGPCEKVTHGRTYVIADRHWRSTVRLVNSCPLAPTGDEPQVFESAGMLERSGDTLTFHCPRPVELGGSERCGHGIVRGDTLRMGDELGDGPVELYLRRRRP